MPQTTSHRGFSRSSFAACSLRSSPGDCVLRPVGLAVACAHVWFTSFALVCLTCELHDFRLGHRCYRR